MTHRNIRFGTNLITFFDPAYWGFEPHLGVQRWRDEFAADPVRYFHLMFDGVAEAGLEGVELAPKPADWEMAQAAFGGGSGLVQALADRGLVLTSSYAHGTDLIGAAIRDPDAVASADDAFRRHSLFLAEAGAHVIVTGNLPRVTFSDDDPELNQRLDFEAPVPREVHEQFADHLNRLGKIVGTNGGVIAIHTDAYSICVRDEDIATVLELTDPATIMLCPDAGHITLDGGDPVAVLRDHIDRIPTMHWKDCIGHLDGRTLGGKSWARHDIMLKNFRILGDGSVDWVAWMRILAEHRWQGWATEENDMAPHPEAELRQGREYFERQLSGIYR
jgi:inosose dehydratase